MLFINVVKDFLSKINLRALAVPLRESCRLFLVSVLINGHSLQNVWLKRHCERSQIIFCHHQSSKAAFSLTYLSLDAVQSKNLQLLLCCIRFVTSLCEFVLDLSGSPIFLVIIYYTREFYEESTVLKYALNYSTTFI